MWYHTAVPFGIMVGLFWLRDGSLRLRCQFKTRGIFDPRMGSEGESFNNFWRQQHSPLFASFNRDFHMQMDPLA